MAGFPNTPSVGQTYTVGTITWEWNGTAWTVKSAGVVELGLNDLSDVVITSPQQDQLIKYEQNTQQWKNFTQDGGTFLGTLDGGNF